MGFLIHRGRLASCIGALRRITANHPDELTPEIPCTEDGRINPFGKRDILPILCANDDACVRRIDPVKPDEVLPVLGDHTTPDFAGVAQDGLVFHSQI